MKDNNAHKLIVMNSQQTYQKRLYSVKEAAYYLGISISTLYKYIEFGIIQYLRLPCVNGKKKYSRESRGKIVFEKVDLDNFIDQKALKITNNNCIN